MSEVFKLKKSDVIVKEVISNLYIWRCPLCNRVFTSHYYSRLLSSAKQHVERTHKLRVEVVE
jgi:transposase-like protein